MRDYLDKLNPPQRAAVTYGDGPMMIVAGAGSGKTRVLTYRIAYLMEKGVDPFHILALTFTNKAAREMKERIAAVVGDSEAKNLWMGTFHSIFARILRVDGERLGFSRNFTIYDTQDSLRLLASIIKEMGLDKEIYKPRKIASRISAFKNNLITVKAYFNNPELIEADALAQRPKMGAIYREYVHRCFKSDAMDFDDLLLRTNELLARFPEVLAKYQSRFRYILVDEYQDTNHSQYIIIKALADRHQNISVVGDDSQSIYGFRGANIRNILSFNRDYPDAAVFKLEQNYRSTKNIVGAANSVIAKNKSKLEKKLWTDNEEGDKVLIKELPSDRDEGSYISNSIRELKEQNGRKYVDFAILYRTNAQSRTIEDALRKAGQPYRIYGGLSFYQRKEIKDVLAYLRLLVNPADEEALLRIVNFPARGIGQTTLDKLAVVSKQLGAGMYETMGKMELTGNTFGTGTKNKLTAFHTMMERFRIYARSHNAYETAEEVIDKTGIIRHYENSGDLEDMIRVENIQELINGISDYVDIQSQGTDADLSLAGFLQDIALATDFDRNDPGDEDVISLMTVHMAKGLEFPYVFVAGLEEGLFPSAMNMSTREDLEEERRLFYVAITRAEKKAVLTYTGMRYRWGRIQMPEASRFLDEIDDRYVIHERDEKHSPSATLDASLFDDTPPQRSGKSKIRLAKPGDVVRRNKKTTPPPSRLTPLSKTTGNATNISIPQLSEGDRVRHFKFGEGTVIRTGGEGADTTAVILFDHGVGEKKLLLRFAKLDILKK